MGRTWARPPDQPSGALSGPRACLCPALILVSHLQSCGPRHPDHPGPEPWPAGQGVESLEDLWVPGPRHRCCPGAGFRGCLSFSVGPRTFAFKRWALQGSAPSSPPPSGRLTKAPQTRPGFPTFEGSSQGLDLWKMENQAPKVLNCN